jgi:hypothetical protein
MFPQLLLVIIIKVLQRHFFILHWLLIALLSFVLILVRYDLRLLVFLILCVKSDINLSVLYFVCFVHFC